MKVILIADSKDDPEEVVDLFEEVAELMPRYTFRHLSICVSRLYDELTDKLKEAVRNETQKVQR